MAQASSGTVSLKVNAAATGGGGLPPSGQALVVANSGGHQSVNNNFNTAGSWTWALFEAYGSGVFNPSYSTDGAFVIASSGGHNHAEIRGAAGFDFTTRSWFYKAPTGVSEKSGTGTLEAETTLTPWYELNVGTTVPAPPHPYKFMTYIPTSNGGGPKGAILHPVRGAVSDQARSVTSSHRMNLDTGTWTRAVATAPGPYWPGNEGSCVYDPVTKRYYLVSGGDLHATSSLYWLDGTTWTWNSVATTASANGAANGGGPYIAAWLYEGNGKRLLMAQWGPNLLMAQDLSALGTWHTLAVSNGPLPADGGTSFNPWTNHTAQNVLYYRNSEGAGQTVFKLTPPANPLTGQWALSTVTLTGNTIPEFIGSGVGTRAYKSLFYIPSLQMLGWVTAFGVALLNP